MKTLMTGVAALLLCATVNAQDKKADPDPVAARVAVYDEALKLEEKQENLMTARFTAAEEEKAPYMKQFLELQGKLEQIDAKAARDAEALLTKEQQQELTQLRKEGKWDGPAAGCEKGAAGKSCCAGGKGHGAHGEAAAPAPQHLGTGK